MSLLSVDKSARAALAVVPPEELWEPIDRIRKKHDKQIVRWMPHLNLLFPFVHPDHLEPGLEKVAQACGEVAPFALTLARFKMFKHGSHKATVWLSPEPREPLDALHAALAERFPHLDTSQQFEAGYTPHLSVGQTRTYVLGRMLVDELNASWEPLRFSVGAVVVLTRTQSGPFRVAHRLPLTGSV